MKHGVISEPWWDDRPTLLIGGGPSLRGLDLSKIKEHGRVVLINDAARFIQGDVLFTADSRWIQSRKELMGDWPGWIGWKGEEIIFTVSRFHRLQNLKTASRITYLERAYPANFSLSTKLDQLTVGGNSGFAALNLAFLKRSKTVYLLGFDLAPGPHANWHDGYKDQNRLSNHGYYKGWNLSFTKVASQLKGRVQVINLNQDSAVRCFEMGRYADLGL